MYDYRIIRNIGLIFRLCYIKIFYRMSSEVSTDPNLWPIEGKR
jgi:hypothetical protein